jgi:hypothetical protein
MTVAAAELKRDERHAIIEGARKEMQAAIADLRSIRTRLVGVEASIPPTAQETSRGDFDGDPDVETELRTVIANGIRNCLDPFIDDLGTAVEYQPGPVAAGSPSIAHLDLSVFSEETRQALYDLVVADNFSLTALEPPGEEWVPPYTAEQAGLEVVFAWGLWFATWWRLELPEDLPEARRREILVLEESPESPGLNYREV